MPGAGHRHLPAHDAREAALSRAALIFGYGIIQAGDIDRGVEGVARACARSQGAAETRSTQRIFAAETRENTEIFCRGDAESTENFSVATEPRRDGEPGGAKVHERGRCGRGAEVGVRRAASVRNRTGGSAKFERRSRRRIVRKAG